MDFGLGRIFSNDAEDDETKLIVRPTYGLWMESLYQFPKLIIYISYGYCSVRSVRRLKKRAGTSTCNCWSGYKENLSCISFYI